MDKKQKLQIIMLIIITISAIITIPIISKKITQKDEIIRVNEAASVDQNEDGSLSDEEIKAMEEMVSYEEPEKGYVAITNINTFDIYNVPDDMKNYLAPYMWLWFKYYTGDESKWWHVTLDGLSYNDDGEIITFEATAEEYPGEIIQGYYYKKRGFCDFYNASIMDVLSEKNSFEELSEE